MFLGEPSALLVYGLLAWEAGAESLKVPRWAVRCGDMSYSIYLVHLLVIHSAYRYALPLFNYPGGLALFLLVISGATIAISVVFYKAIERPLSQWVRIRMEKLFKVPSKIASVPTLVDLKVDPLVVEGSLQSKEA